MHLILRHLYAFKDMFRCECAFGLKTLVGYTFKMDGENMVENRRIVSLERNNNMFTFPSTELSSLIYEITKMTNS